MPPLRRDTPPTQSLFRYFQTGWGEATERLNSLAALGRELGNTPLHHNKLWYFAVQIEELVLADKNEPERFALTPLERMAIGMIDAEAVQTVAAAVRKVQQILASGLVDAVVAARDVPVGIDLPKMALTPESMAALGIEEETLQAWQTQFARQNESAERAIVRELQRVEAPAVRLQFQLAFVATLCGIVPYDSALPYEIDELRNLLLAQTKTPDKQELDIFRFIRSSIEAMKNEDHKALIDVFILVLSSSQFANIFLCTWTEAFLLGIIMHVTWHRFDLLSDEYQQILLQNYVWRAVLAGVPVRERLNDVLYRTYTPITYITRCATLYELFRNCLDVVPLDRADAAHTQVGLIVQNDIDGKPSFSIEQYIQDTYGTHSDTAILRARVRYLLQMIVDVKEARLCATNAGGTLTARDEAYNDMVKLIGYLAIGEAGRAPIIEYFYQLQPHVSLGAFWQRASEVIDEAKESLIEQCVALIGALQEAGLMSIEQDVLAFDERTGRFHWQKDFISQLA